MENWRDWQSVAYLIALPGLVIWLWMEPNFNLPSYIGLLTLVVGVCCISHNHAHLPIWRGAWLNYLTDMWIGTLQGHPVFLFHPAHIESHHRYNQGDDDITRVSRYSKNNNLLGYLIFPFQVLPALKTLKRQFIVSIWRNDRSHFWRIFLLHTPLAALWISVLTLDVYKALIYVFIPQCIGLHFLLASNYLQHAHAVAESNFNHSRNFVGHINWAWFNVGYHTAHHENEKLHWSALPLAHKRISGKIDLRLNVPSLISYTFKTMLLGMVIPRFKSKPMEFDNSRIFPPK
jgi:beta-carotene hydroxylase